MRLTYTSIQASSGMAYAFKSKGDSFIPQLDFSIFLPSFPMSMNIFSEEVANRGYNH